MHVLTATCRHCPAALHVPLMNNIAQQTGVHALLKMRGHGLQNPNLYNSMSNRHNKLGLTSAVLLQVPSAQESLDANKEELFDVIACYFPISFSPPPNNVHGITRQDLAAALQDALTCTPLFAPLFIPMLLEKLSSSLR